MTAAVLASLRWESPRWLVVLYLFVVAVAIYSLGSRWRRKMAVNFSGAELLARVARRPKLLRLVAPLCVVIAALLTSLAAAGPTWVKSDIRRIVVAVDVSNSMTATDMEPSRLLASQEAMKVFLAAVPDTTEVGLVLFDRSVRQSLPPGTPDAAILAAFENLETSGGSSTGDAIYRAAELADKTGSIIVISDGAASDGAPSVEASADVLRSGTKVYTIAVGDRSGVAVVDGRPLEVPVQTEELAGTAAAGGGKFYTAVDVGQLENALATIVTNMPPAEDSKPLAGPMAGIAAVLLSLALLVASRWSLRLP